MLHGTLRGLQKILSSNHGPLQLSRNTLNKLPKHFSREVFASNPLKLPSSHEGVFNGSVLRESSEILLRGSLKGLLRGLLRGFPEDHSQGGLLGRLSVLKHYSHAILTSSHFKLSS